jgi:hypothetical protein
MVSSSVKWFSSCSGMMTSYVSELAWKNSKAPLTLHGSPRSDAKSILDGSESAPTTFL